ncbi:hypothetical protein BO86DRAFT_213013 [Aspergillus japonicus CBS 114.51]|uniref:Uncharacterized protein n=2 Tax=Aspergillus TaxID=5052 RepID=A0A2V5HF15_ASPV1|nr:hypothetical protein BO86DRAFT_213013 [Aspergillus japonicus CBS 114.51]PYI22948.1 hypothetical protein BO99DRAFT_242313 [Aspergillus violaceofuscus CBS 115571]RAH85102.1 hypothetical protein BO86DRAFT_213013 [Aspergillus japonicus CBS 114.51]
MVDITQKGKQILRFQHQRRADGKSRASPPTTIYRTKSLVWLFSIICLIALSLACFFCLLLLCDSHDVLASARRSGEGLRQERRSTRV